MLYWVTSTEEASGGQDIGTAQPIFFPQRWNRKGSSIIGWLQKILGQGECRKGTSFNQRENYVGKGCLLFLGGCTALNLWPWISYLTSLGLDVFKCLWQI
jgi:hypothetical protein